MSSLSDTSVIFFSVAFFFVLFPQLLIVFIRNFSDLFFFNMSTNGARFTRSNSNPSATPTLANIQSLIMATTNEIKSAKLRTQQN